MLSVCTHPRSPPLPPSSTGTAVTEALPTTEPFTSVTTPRTEWSLEKPACVSPMSKTGTTRG